jgi:DMSO/TMAO reductase YedYZ molybdopterin-dependent catalytic subunit
MEIREFYKWPSRSPGDGGQRSLLTRRTLLGFGLTALVQGEEPELSSFDLSLLDEPAVPNELFFVREHFPQPRVSAASWKLSITGTVSKPCELSLDEISSTPRKVVPATLECAENQVGGGMVSHAEWAGATLASLIERAQPKPGAVSVRLSGADGFTRSIPISKAMHPDTLIAYGMNGEKLHAKHGLPLRAIVPGWYGMDSVKCLREIAVLSEQDGDATNRYIRLTRSLLTGTRPAGAVTAMNVKSAFSRPVDGAILTSRRFTIRGAAWAGENRIRQVEVSTDGGNTWRDTTLTEQPAPYCWVLWASEWKIPGAGEHELLVRATDDQGRTQPSQRATDRADDYELNSYQRIRVVVI